MLPPLNVAFLHPGLGIGGAERLVVDAACVLQAQGHRVSIVTTDYDPQRSLEETRSGRFPIYVHGSWLPLHVGGRLRAPCNIARTLVAARALLRLRPQPDVIFCDLLSHAVPLLQQRTPTVFYCHFPDQLLTPRRTFFYKLYRAALDRYEEWSTGCADRVLVNSRFTAGVFQDTFPSLRHIDPDVLYPGVRCGADTPPMAPAADDRITLLSINRFDPSKNLTLAVDAFAALRGLLDTSLFRRTRLVLAGSVDRRLTEQGQLLKLLQRRIDELQLHEQVELLTSVSDARREALLNACRAVVYTPIAEHFGLVPLEAMAAGRPVVAVDCGGPRETVRHAITGFLCAPEPAEFAAAMAQLVSSQPLAIQMGAMARRHVEQNFSLAVFGERLEAILRAVCRDDGVTDA